MESISSISVHCSPVVSWHHWHGWIGDMMVFVVARENVRTNVCDGSVQAWKS